jgi:hypothetical protein
MDALGNKITLPRATNGKWKTYNGKWQIVLPLLIAEDDT